MAHWTVEQDPKNSRDILFSELDKLPAPLDENSFREEIDKTLTVLRMLFPPGNERFPLYFEQLLSLAQVGLVNPGDLTVARSALAQVKADVTATEAGNIKNQYMKQLGTKSVVIGLPALAIAMNLLAFQLFPVEYATALLAWTGCMAGVWLSFGARKTTLGFDDLNILEQDRLEPVIRLIFAGLLTIIIYLLFDLGAIKVSLGTLATANIGHNGEVALLVGLLCGFSEQALATTVGKQAAQLLK